LPFASKISETHTVDIEPTEIHLDLAEDPGFEEDPLPVDIYLSRRFDTPALGVYAWDLKNCLEEKPLQKGWVMDSIERHEACPGVDYVIIPREGGNQFLFALHFARRILADYQHNSHFGLCAQLIRAERRFVKKATEEFERTRLKSSTILSKLATLPGLGLDIEQAPGKGSIAVLSIQYSRLEELVEHVHALAEEVNDPPPNLPGSGGGL